MFLSCLYVFGQLSIQVSAHFSSGLFVFDEELYELFTYFG